MNMTKVNTYSAKGRKLAKTNLPKNFSEKENRVLLAQAIRVYESRRHPGVSKTKRRGEITASTRKIYRQKGTGRARHGALSAPIFVGGGKAHGPTGLKRKLRLPKRMRTKVINIALSSKVKEGRLVVVKGLTSLKKTKDAQKLIDTICAKEIKEKSPMISVIVDKKNKQASLAFRNIKNVKVIPFATLNAYLVFYSGMVLLDEDALKNKKEVEK